MINADSKILIVNSMGRSGTTLLQSMLCAQHGLTNLYELIPYDHSRDAAIDQLAGSTGWVCKLFVEMDTIGKWDHLGEIDRISPDLIYNAYRRDRFDQFISFQISLLNDRWNAATRLAYEPKAIPDPAGSVAYFLDSLDVYDTLLSEVRKRHHVIDMSYEDIVEEMRSSGRDYGVAKQNTVDQKRSLVTNLDEVEKEWASAMTARRQSSMKE